MPSRRDEATRKQLAALRERMNQLFDEASEPWVPPADVYHSKDQVVITVELPGVREDAFAVEAEGRVLRLRGQKPAAAPGERGALQLERSYGPFLREFQLPTGARAEKQRVHCADGVLRIEIPMG